MSVFGQTAPAFEVASIRPHDPPIRFVSANVSGTRATWTAYPLLGLLMEAYNVQPYQVSGGPPWIESDRFDIAAKASGDRELTKDQVRQMLEGLLADRFHLKVHRETKELPIYVLVVAKNGPKLKESPADAEFSMSAGGRGQRIELRFSKGTMARLALQLSNDGGRKVVDMTNLTGDYDYTLSYVDDRRAVAPEQDGPSLFTALQEQLGLRLEAQKGPVDVLVVDHADKPSEN